MEQPPLQMTGADGAVRAVMRPPIVLRWFADSEGMVLREIGEEAYRAAEWVMYGRTEELLRFVTDGVRRAVEGCRR